MNLGRHAAVLWRFRAVTATGVFLGIMLAILASYRISWDGSINIESRGVESWSSDSQLLVTQRGFPEGRVILPSRPVEADDPTGTEQAATDAAKPEIEFADPARFSGLADLYAQLAMSDQVRNRIPGKPKPSQITAISVQSASGSLVLPVIKLTTTADSAANAQRLNVSLAKALRNLLETEQNRNNVPVRQRVQLPLLNAPAAPVMLSGPSHTASVLALLLCLIATIAITHLLEALRTRKRPARAAEPTDESGPGGIVLPWTTDADAERVPVAGKRPAP